MNFLLLNGRHCFILLDIHEEKRSFHSEAGFLENINKLFTMEVKKYSINIYKIVKTCLIDLM